MTISVNEKKLNKARLQTKEAKTLFSLTFSGSASETFISS